MVQTLAPNRQVFQRPSHTGTSHPDSSDRAPFRVWVDEPAHFTSHDITAVHHSFETHPLMQLPRLARLARELFAQGQCRFMTPGATPTSGLEDVLKDATPDGRTIDDAFRRIEEPGTWVALYNVESDPEYAGFLAEVMDAVQPLVGHTQPGIFKVSGYAFVSAPPSFTPFHVDRENNFWLQMRGRKSMTVWDRTDRDVVAAKEIEDFVVHGSLDQVKLDERLHSRGREFRTGPGDGVYFPATSPHMTRSDPDWVTPGDGVSVSMAVVFYTSETRRHARVHQINRELRRLGFAPRFPGESLLSDTVKAAVGRLVGAARQARSGSTRLPPGSY